MAFFLGIQIPNTLTIPLGLQKIYGLGYKSGLKICYAVGLNKAMLFQNLTNSQRTKLQKYITDNYILQGALKKNISLNISRLIDNKSYKGKRHSLNLPVHGQRTRTNARISRKKTIKK